MDRTRKPAARRAPTVSIDQEFVARLGNMKVTTNEDAFDIVGTEEDKARRGNQDVFQIEHTTDAKVTMWKPLNNGFGDFLPREIPVSNITMCLNNGWKTVCPMCHTTDCSNDPNSCAGRGQILYRVCPECGKRVYDNKSAQLDAIADSEDAEPEEEDPNLIKDDTYLSSTPQSRTKARLDRHMLAYHPEEAGSRGLLPQTPRDPTEQQVRTR